MSKHLFLLFFLINEIYFVNYIINDLQSNKQKIRGINLPTYEFCCKKCNHVYESIAKFDETGKYQDVTCPSCNSKSKKKLINSANIKFAQPKDTSKFDNFSYRAGYNLEQATDLRRKAEEASHMGTDPYMPIDDITKGKYFGEVQ